MKKKNVPIYQSADFYITRVATLPFQEVYKPTDQWGFDLYRKEKLFQEALFFASPSLRKMLDSKKVSTGVFESLLKYFLRSTTRATPFGLFSGTTFCKWTSPTKASWEPELLESYARVDIAWLHKLTKLLQENKEYKNCLRFRRNPHLMISGGRLSLQTKEILGKASKSREVSIRLTPLLSLILELTQVPHSSDSLFSEMEKVIPQLDIAKTEKIIESLIHQNVLTYALIPSLLTEDIFTSLNYEGLENSFQEIQEDLHRYCNTPPGQGSHIIALLEEKLLGLLKQLDPEISSNNDSQNLLNIDLYQPSTSSFLPKQVADEVGAAADTLWKFSHIFKNSHDLQNYHAKFVEKYGILRCVPISEVVSVDVGIGLPPIYTDEPAPKQVGHGWKNWLKKKLFSSLKNEFEEMEITDSDLELLLSSYDLNEAPPSCDLFFELSANPNETSDYQIILNTLVQQGMASIGRFFYLLNTNQKELVQEAYNQEESLDPETEYIETSFLPGESRGANIATHQNLRKNSLDFVNPSKGSLQLTDVYIGATESTLFLANKEGQELLMTAGNVLNPTYAPLILRLMRDISKMRFVNHYPWSWMGFEDAPFLPRVRYKNIILSRAQWIFDLPPNEMKKHKKKNTLLDEFNKWADLWNVPKQFYIGFDDNRLLVDRTNPIYNLLITKEVERESHVLIREHIGSPWIQSSEGNHFSEFVVPVIKKAKYSSHLKHHLTHSNPNASFRYQPIGSDWIYFKLYLGRESNSSFILNQLRKFIAQFEHHDLFKKWYFIRYVDPSNHLRVRINGEPRFLMECILPHLGNWIGQLYENRCISQFDISVYDREVERYGGAHLMEIAEMLFCNDTEVSIALMEAMRRKQITFPDYIVAALSIIDFMSRLDLNFEKLIEFFTPPDESDKLFLKNGRRWKKELSRLIKIVIYKDSFLTDEDKTLLDIFKLRSNAMEEYKKVIKEAKAQGKIPKDYGYTLQSFIHMHLNRLLGYERSDEIKARVFAHYGLTSLYHLEKIRTLDKSFR